MQQQLYGAIEFGGTKTICAIGYASGELVAQANFSTTSVDETLGNIYHFFGANEPISALGVGAFGPLNLDIASLDYGAMHNTPKPGWENVNLKTLLSEHFKVPITIDLDVNAAALGELHFGVAKGLNNFVYLTLGTGIGGSLIMDGKVTHGIRNLEMGHMRIPHETFSNGFEGTCPFHKDCLEGIASGYAMEQRYHQKAELLDSSADEAIWGLEASYIAVALNNIMMTFGPEVIILGGSLMKNTGILEAIHHDVATHINGYMTFPDLNTYIVRSSGETNGVLGAIQLAAKSAANSQ